MIHTHTPGPWSVKARKSASVDGKSDHTFYEIAESGSSIGEAFNKADAKLMAAAPELLQALQTLVGLACWNPDVHSRDILAARAVIEKALQD